VHVSRGITTHGFAINVNNDLQPFEWIVPCGIEACRMSSLSRELGGEQDLAAFATTVRDSFGEIYGRAPREASAEELEERLGEPLALA
jgi:lipoyl(octanoyl) transferase